MRIAIISDIHSNLEALQKSISIIEENKVDKIICLGDVVGYGANPKECLKIIHEISSFILLGNHDQAAADVRYTESFTVYANVAARWTNKILTESEKELLLSFPLSIESDGITYVHASPYRPSEWDY
ncbi:MAG: metallophosphoesterase, partial [Bacteroidetes bacterium]|nr:metallophosphoesterase [Bacteroidota bacterium]